MCDEVIVRFSDIDAPEIQGTVATALADKVFVLECLGQTEAATATLDEVLRRLWRQRHIGNPGVGRVGVALQSPCPKIVR